MSEHQYIDIPEGIEYKCLVCDKHIRMWDDLCRQTSHPLSFRDPCIILNTQGNWGSQVHDMGNNIHFVVCDGCFVKKSKNCIEVSQGFWKDGVFVPEVKVRQADIGFQEFKEYLEKQEDSEYNRTVLSYFD